MIEKHYHINIFWSEEDQCYIADIPYLEYCSAHGITPEEALHEAIIARDTWLQVAEEEEKTIPEPKYRPVKYV
jgi:predicted RNase H-like HicB family nuclease